MTKLTIDLKRSGLRPTEARLSAPIASAPRSTPIAPAKSGSARCAVSSSPSPLGRSSPAAKLPIRDYLAGITIFINAVKGISALQLGRDLDVQYKTAFVMAHKIREAIGADRNHIILTGTVEVDGA
jgi:hypothetical protein